MTLETSIRGSALWRPHGMPFGGRNYVIACYRSEIEHLGRIVNRQNHSLINRVAVFDPGDHLPDAAEVAIGPGETLRVKLSGVSSLASSPHCEAILFSHDYNYLHFLNGQRALISLGFKAFFVAMPYLYNSGIKTAHLPDYYAKHRPELEEAFALLEDEESRKVFASRVRALLTGNVGYLRISEHPQYFHPVVRPRPGDVVIDGGVSEYLLEQVEISTAVGPAGRVIGFEPDPVGFLKAHDKLQAHAACANYSLLAYGLWNRKETVRFNSSGVGSHVADAADGGAVEVQMTTVDAVVKEYSLNRVDFIKLDVEGSEFNAVRGALGSIVKFKPRLAVSIYHKFEDLYELPQLVRKILPDYRLFVGHHHPALFDTVLYACPA